MSPTIWTQCGASSNVRRLSATAWRVVESQYIVATRKLVDSDDEQELLEALIDTAKPPLAPELAHLHYLLATPFRHPPLRHGSRFGTRFERGIWYGAKRRATAFAEVAYYRLVFLEGSTASLAPLTVELSAFVAKVRARRGVDLTRAPFAAYGASISSKTSYAASQTLGREMRRAGVEAFLFVSARDPMQGVCVGLFAPCFVEPRPSALESWICTASHARVELTRKDVLVRERLSFARAVFEVDGRLPAPAV